MWKPGDKIEIIDVSEDVDRCIHYLDIPVNISENTWEAIRKFRSQEVNKKIDKGNRLC